MHSVARKKSQQRIALAVRRAFEKNPLIEQVLIRRPHFGDQGWELPTVVLNEASLEQPQASALMGSLRFPEAGIVPKRHWLKVDGHDLEGQAVTDRVYLANTARPAEPGDDQFQYRWVAPKGALSSLRLSRVAAATLEALIQGERL